MYVFGICAYKKTAFLVKRGFPPVLWIRCYSCHILYYVTTLIMCKKKKPF